MSNPDISEDVYERLADALDALPAGFTRTPSKLEIKLIKMVFTPEEALIASTLSRKPETADEIAKRVGLPVDKVTVLLEGMIPRRMVRVDTLALETGVKGLGKVEAKPGQKAQAESVKRYRLSPFLVGWYESFVQNNPPEVKEFARTFEQYVIEGGGKRSSRRGPAPRASFPTAARSSRSGSSGSPTMTSTRTSKGMSVSSSSIASAKWKRWLLTAIAAICPIGAAALSACRLRRLSPRTC